MTTIVGDSATRVLLATLSDPHPSYPQIAEATGLSPSTVAWHLRRLRRLGLVDWRDRSLGTIRPLVRIMRPRLDETVPPGS